MLLLSLDDELMGRVRFLLKRLSDAVANPPLFRIFL